MKKLILSAIALAAVVFGANAADPANTNTANVDGQAAANLQAVIGVSTITTGSDGTTNVTNGGKLDFGTINIDGTLGSVVVSPVHQATYAGGAAAGAGAVTSAAAFKVSGILNNTYSVSVADAQIARAVTGETLAISNFTQYAQRTIGGTDASNTFFVGGKLNIPVNARTGSYSGSFNVVVAYN